MVRAELHPAPIPRGAGSLIWRPAPSALSVAVAGAIVLGPACAGDMPELTLCRPPETVVFACDLGKRRVALCLEPGSEQVLVYRFGRPGRIELQHRAAATHFWRSEQLTYGGSEVEVGFSRGGWDYRLYARTGRGEANGSEPRVPEAEDGLRVARRGSLGRASVCVDGGLGFRADLGALPAKP